MKAITATAYGTPEVLQLQELPRPVPKSNEILIKIHASTVTAGDCEVRRFDFPLSFWLLFRLMFGVFKPRIKVLGQEFAGEVEEVGKEVTIFKKGDKIFGPSERLRTHAEYLCLKAGKAIAHKPENISFEEAATLPVGGLNALHFLRKADLQPGQKLLIIGAGGSIGSYAIQIARLMGAEVTAVDSTSKLDTLRSIGADHVVDYTQEDFSASGEKYDVVFDIVGKDSYRRGVKSLKPGGLYLITNLRVSQIVSGMWISRFGGKRVSFALAGYSAQDLDYLAGLMAEGKLRSVIDKKYPLEQVAEAHRYVETGQKAGHVVIKMNEAK